MNVMIRTIRELEVSLTQKQREIALLKTAISCLQSIDGDANLPVAVKRGHKRAGMSTRSPAKKRRLSRAGREAIRAGIQARWAKVRAKQLLQRLGRGVVVV